MGTIQGKSYNLLFVGNELELFAQAEAYLKDFGHQIFIASDLDDALERFVSNQIDTVFCTFSVGTDSGTDFLCEALSEKPQVPVIMLAKESEMDQVLPALRYGAYDYITLPLPHSSSLLQAVEAATAKNVTAREQQDEMEMALEELNYHRKSLLKDPNMASLFQASLFPEQNIESGVLQVEWRMPLKPRASRYFLDVIPLSEQYTSFYLADFGENPAEAAFSSGLLKVVFNEVSRKAQSDNDGVPADPKEILYLAGSSLEAMELEQVPALLYALLDVQKGKMKWTSAGFEKGPYIWLESATQLIADAGLGFGQEAAPELETFEFNVENSMPLVFSHLPGEEVLRLAESHSSQQLPLAESDLLSQPSVFHKNDSELFSFVVRRKDATSA